MPSRKKAAHSLNAPHYIRTGNTIRLNTILDTGALFEQIKAKRRHHEDSESLRSAANRQQSAGQRPKSSATRARTRAARVRAEHPSQLDFSAVWRWCHARMWCLIAKGRRRGAQASCPPACANKARAAALLKHGKVAASVPLPTARAIACDTRVARPMSEECPPPSPTHTHR